MRLLARRLTIATGCWLAFTLARAEDSALPKASPFAPPASPSTASAPAAENYELAAISTIGTKTTVNIFDRAAKKGRWIAVGETSDGIKVLRFDAAREQVVVRIGNGPEKMLTLRRASGPSVMPPVALGAPAGHASPAIPPAAAQVEPAMVAPAPSPATLAAPGTVAYQEQEARMLVSDLLEIGMAQRKAYEEAQRNAAQAAQNATRAPHPPPPQTKSPAKP